ARVHFRQGDVQRRPLGRHLDLDAGTHGGCIEAVLPAVAAQKYGRRSSTARRTLTDRRKSGTGRSVGTRAPAAAERAAARAAEAHAADVALADRGVPVGPCFARRL